MLHIHKVLLFQRDWWLKYGGRVLDMHWEAWVLQPHPPLGVPLAKSQTLSLNIFIYETEF